METRNQRFPVLRAATTSAPRSSRGRRPAGPVGPVRRRSATSFLRLLLWQGAGVGAVAAGIALDGALRPPPGIELVGQVGVLFAALILSWRGLVRFFPDLDRRWRVGRKMF